MDLVSPKPKKQQDVEFYFLGHDYKIAFVESDQIDGNSDNPDYKTLGEYNGRTRTVTIDQALTSSHKSEVILHELMHLCEHKLGYAFDESVIAGLTTLIYGLLAENEPIRALIFPKD